jgi:hypothetical protein
MLGVEILALLALGFIIPLVSIMSDLDEPRRVLHLSLHYFFLLTGITLILCAVIGGLEWIFIRPLL